jgi:hypothetical protein
LSKFDRAIFNSERNMIEIGFPEYRAITKIYSPDL